MIRTLAHVLSAALLAASFGALAAEPSVEEMIDALAPKPTTPLTRGLSRGMKPAPQVREGRLQLSVQFDYASASLTAEGRDLLTRLATAMRSPNLSQLRYRIEGHTDSSGDPQRNQNLSERRAATVAQFLSSSTGIEAQRMNRVGLGSTVPANEVDSKAAENRRVVIVSLEAGEAPPAAEQKAQKGGGVVQQVKGSLYANRAGDTTTLRAGARIAERDVLTTTGRSTALLKMDDGANLLLREDTTIEVRKLQARGEPGAVGQVFELLVGAFRYVSGSLGTDRPDSIAFVTSTATLGLRGTDIDVVHRPLAAATVDPGTYVKVNRGAVALGGLDGSFVQIAKDQQAYAGKPATLMRGGKSGPVTMRIEAPADMFRTGELDALLPR
jgi:outer membrane protein OmpA-like peptidoglycan-associated protein